MSENQNLAAAAAAAERKIPTYTFTVPESARRPGDPRVIKIRELTYSEEKAAMLAKANGGNVFEYEGAMRAIVAFDGKVITWDEDGKQNAFEALSPKVRDLLAGGFLKYCLPTKDEREDFFKSVVVEVPA